MSTPQLVCNKENEEELQKVLSFPDLIVRLSSTGFQFPHIALMTCDKDFGCVYPWQRTLDAIKIASEIHPIHFQLGAEACQIIDRMDDDTKRKFFVFLRDIQTRELTISLNCNAHYRVQDMCHFLELLRCVKTKSITIISDYKYFVIPQQLKRELMTIVWYSQTTTVNHRGDGFLLMDNYLWFKDIYDIAQVPLGNRPISIVSTTNNGI